jgi:hypothetical protein
MAREFNRAHILAALDRKIPERQESENYPAATVASLQPLSSVLGRAESLALEAARVRIV